MKIISLSSYIFDAKYSTRFLVLLLLVFFVFTPIFVYLTIIEDENYVKTSALCITAILGMVAAKRIPTIRFLNKEVRKIEIPSDSLVFWSLIFFISFVFITIVTAKTIPILGGLKGLTSTELSVERGEFLKGREGGWIVLLYLSSILTSSLMPYVICVAYLNRNKWRVPFTIAFLFYSAIFLVKTLFLNLVIPLMAMGYYLNPRKSGRMLLIAVFAVFFILFMISISGYGGLGGVSTYAGEEYFTSTYVPNGAIDYFVYRAFSIPVFTVIDTLHVHSVTFDGRLLYGATSGLLSSVTGLERVNLERHVAEFQYGGWNDFANSNVVFFVDGYVNFGWTGTFFFGFIVGRVLRVFSSTLDICLRFLSLLFCFQLLSSPLIQMFLSNGWLALLIFNKYFSVKKYDG